MFARSSTSSGWKTAPTREARLKSHVFDGCDRVISTVPSSGASIESTTSIFAPSAFVQSSDCTRS